MKQPFACRARRALLLAGLISGAHTGALEWSEAAPPIAFREFLPPGSVRTFVVRPDRRVNSWAIGSMISLGEIKGRRQTPPDPVSCYQDSIGSTGKAQASCIWAGDKPATDDPRLIVSDTLNVIVAGGQIWWFCIFVTATPRQLIAKSCHRAECGGEYIL